MDQRSRVLSRPIVGLATLTAVGVALLFWGNIQAGDESSAASALPDLPELAWIAPSANRVAVLTTEPASCLLPAQNPEHAAQIRAGELVFKSHVLLGEQAAKAKLSCNSCHRNGRGNPDFYFEGISGEPGTADVTSGIFGKHRADDIFNPVPIPDLALPDGQDQVDRSDRNALAVFTHGQIEEEFSGAVPPQAVMEALLAYVVAIDQSGCGANSSLSAMQAITWQQDWNAARDAARFCEQARNSNDSASAGFYVRVARAALERLFVRYAGDAHVEIRSRLVALSRQLAQSGPASVWPDDADQLERLLDKHAAISLYRAEVLTVMLGD